MEEGTNAVATMQCSGKNNNTNTVASVAHIDNTNTVAILKHNDKTNTVATVHAFTVIIQSPEWHTFTNTNTVVSHI